MLKGSLVIFNNVLWRFELCVEIFFVFYLLIELGAIKSSAVWINSQISNNMVQTMKKGQNSRSMLPSSANYKKITSYKKTKCSSKWKLFHCYVIGLVQRGNISTFLILYSLRYFTWPFCLGKIIKITNCLYQATHLVQSAIITSLARGTFATINKFYSFNGVLFNTCSQTQTLAQMTLKVINNKYARIMFL